LPTKQPARSNQERDDTRIVQAYLEALAASRPKRGRKRDPNAMKARVAEIERTFDTAPPLTQLHLAQERIDLEAALAAAGARQAREAAERDFVKVAKRYGTTRGISYEAWRATGVPPNTLREAGICPS
jgi:hypothetical protein